VLPKKKGNPWLYHRSIEVVMAHLRKYSEIHIEVLIRFSQNISINSKIIFVNFNTYNSTPKAGRFT